jgi:hypothetical protein
VYTLPLSNLKKKKDEAKELWLTNKVVEIETLMTADTRTAWRHIRTSQEDSINENEKAKWRLLQKRS